MTHTEYDPRDDDRRETMERLQAGDIVDKLEAEIALFEQEMQAPCDRCGVHICTDHAAIAEQIADRQRIIKEIDHHYEPKF